MNRLLIKSHIYFILVLSVAFAENTFGPYTADANTVLLLNFDSDHSNAGNGGDATVEGTLTHTDAGKHGNAAYFNNSAVAINDSTNAPSDTSYLMFADHANLDLEESWTIEFWAKSNARHSWSSNMSIVSKPDTAVGTVNPGGNGGALTNYTVGLNGSNVTQMWRDSDAMLKRAFDVGGVADYDSTSMAYPWVHVCLLYTSPSPRD